MLKNLTLENILFLDIESASEYPTYSEQPESFRPLWKQKAERFARMQDLEWDEEVAAQMYQQKAAIFAEFGRVVVISVGFIHKTENGLGIKLKTFADPEEEFVLQEFNKLITHHFNNPNRHMLCGHNIKEFDVPFLCRRMVIKGIEIPDMINVTGKKPWETNHLLDTMNLWKFGDFKHFTSLNLLAHILGIPTPKDDIDGSEVGRVFWEDNDLERIGRYCEKDVATVAQLLLKFTGNPLIPAEQVVSVTNFT